MELAKIRAEKSLAATLKNMPIGREQIISSKLWTSLRISKEAWRLKQKGYCFQIQGRGLLDTIVTRLK